MSKKVCLLVVVLGFATGALLTFYMLGVPMSAVFSFLVGSVKSVVTRIQTVWSSIPETIRGITLLGIPTAFATFLAWTKTRAMQQVQQTQQEAAEWRRDALNQANTSVILQKSNEELQGQVQTLQDKVTGELSTLKQQLTAKDSLIEQQKREIERIRTEAKALSHISEENIADRIFKKQQDAERAD